LSSEQLTSTPSYVQPIRVPNRCVGACREGCFHAHTPLHIHMITMHIPPPKHHRSQRPGIPISLSAISPPLTLSPRRVHRPRASSTPTAPHHHRWQVLPPLRTSPISLLDSRSHAASQQLRTSACAPRHCYTNTVVCRARRTRGSRRMALCHSARERSHSSLLAVGRCLAGRVCTVSQGAQLRAGGERRVVVAL
jgi:hypothetical protein